MVPGHAVQLRSGNSVLARGRAARQRAAGRRHGVRAGRLPAAHHARGYAGERWVVYYSPKTAVEGELLREFTAIGFVAEGNAYEFRDPATPSGTYVPWRRRIDYDTDAVSASIRPLLNVLEFTRSDPDWGYQLRRGLLEISRHDYDLIRRQMRRM